MAKSRLDREGLRIRIQGGPDVVLSETVSERLAHAARIADLTPAEAVSLGLELLEDQARAEAILYYAERFGVVPLED